MYQPFHKLRVRFAELEMKQGEVAKRANMAESTLTARMTGLPGPSGPGAAHGGKPEGAHCGTDRQGAGHSHRPDRCILLR